MAEESEFAHPAPDSMWQCGGHRYRVIQVLALRYSRVVLYQAVETGTVSSLELNYFRRHYSEAPDGAAEVSGEKREPA
jgi:hypothetical protein